MITYRKSKVSDSLQIQQLLSETFGIDYLEEYIEHIENRYLLAFDKDVLIAITGVGEFGDFKSLEVDWTVCKEKYRHRGIITNMLKQLIEPLDCDVYCSCWRLEKDGNIQLNYSMKALGFVEVDRGMNHFKEEYFKCMECPYKKLRENCECWTDLYLRKIEVSNKHCE